MSLAYAWEKTHSAVVHLAASEADPRQRLISAFINDITHIRVEELPEDIKSEFEDLMADVTSEEPIAREGLISASISKLSIVEASRIAERVVTFYDNVTRRHAIESRS